MPYRDSPHHEIETLMSFDYLHLFRPNEHTEDYHIRKPNNEKFLFKIENKKNIHVGEKLFSFETDHEISEYSSEHGYNDFRYLLLAVMKTFTSFYIKNMFFFKNMKIHQ